MKWDDPVSVIKGVGKKKTGYLANNNIFKVKDLLNIFPVKYIDRNYMPREDDLIDNELMTFKGVFQNIGNIQFVKSKLNLFTCKVKWESYVVTIVYFNQAYLRNTLKLETPYFFYGRIRKEGHQLKMINPQIIEAKNPKSFFNLQPVYSQVQGLNKNDISKMIGTILENLSEWPIDLPLWIRRKYHLCSNHAAYRYIHKPTQASDLNIAIKRFKYDEALTINCGILSTSLQNNSSMIELNYFDGLNIFINSLPFELTSDQTKIIGEIVAELKAKKTINRLIQGDVGSGKTVIAIAIACIMGQNGYQVAYMAPTEILADQHYQTFKNYLKHSGLSIGLLTGSLSPKEQKEIKNDLLLGKLSIIIGTHALFQESVNYYNLGLVITDEQHRFGVRQKAKLMQKGFEPHTLVMSATPIPRTLALIFYGDLAVSYLNEMPKGRKRVKTHCYSEKSLLKIYDFLRAEMTKKRQVFVICPFVEASDMMEEVNDIESVFKNLQALYEPEFKIAFLHGKKSAAEKNSIINDFNAGFITLLVATSIVEVGIDVPNATAIVILNAERFGLAQLHQLRGRVGRGNIQSFCFLVTNSKNEETIQRMRVIVENNSGKDIAEEDLKLRGPGDYFGYKQHGLPDMRWLNPLEDINIIDDTRSLAKEIIQSKEKETMIYYDKILNYFYQSITEISLN